MVVGYGWKVSQAKGATSHSPYHSPYHLPKVVGYKDYLEIPGYGYIQYRNDRLGLWRYGLCRQDCQ
jgi:hypothetical protein